VADGQRQGAAAGEEAGLAVGSPAWFAWLADDATRSFSFRSPAWSTIGLPCPPQALLVLDDYHLVRAQAVQDAVAFLLEHLPPALHLVIASREDPPLPLPRVPPRFSTLRWTRPTRHAAKLTTIASIVALVLLWDDPGSTSFVLTAIGLAVVVVGILIVSNVWKTPTYKMILAWDPEALPADWEATRQRYFTINWIQLATTWGAFALFLVALISL
jgi:hypothetical protein